MPSPAERGAEAIAGPAAPRLRGWSSPELDRLLANAREVAATLGDPARISTVLSWQATVHLHRGEHRRAQELMEAHLRSLGLGTDSAKQKRPRRHNRPSDASSLPSDPAALESIELLAGSFFRQGRFALTLRLAEQGLELQAPPCPGPLTLALGKDPNAACQGWAALALWFLGRPDRAAQQAEAMMKLASEPGHAHGLPFARTQVTVFHQIRREPDAVRVWAQTAITRSTGHEPPHRSAASAVLGGWARVFQSERAREIAHGLAEIDSGLAAYRATGTTVDLAYLLGVHADALQRAGKLDEALAEIAQARRTVPRTRPFYWQAELDRLEGCIFLEQGDGQRGETCLQRARDLARRQEALTIELRTACCQARLLDSRGDTAGARALLSQVYSRFDEGLRTPDLREAAALLETL